MKGKKLIAIIVSVVVLLFAALSVTVMAEETYNIQFVNNSGGKLSIQCYSSIQDAVDEANPRTSFAAGEKVQVRVLSNDPYYTASSLTAKNANGKTVSVTKNAVGVNDRTYSFTMSSSDVTLTLESKPLEFLHVYVTPEEAAGQLKMSVLGATEYNSVSFALTTLLEEDGSGHFVYGYDPVTMGNSKILYNIRSDDYYPAKELIDFPANKCIDISLEKINKTTSINTVDDLLNFADTLNRGYVYNGDTVSLNADLDLSGVDWIPMGTNIGANGKEEAYWFEGTFDGKGHTISNLNVQYRDGKVSKCFDGGLFEGLNKATVKNLVLQSPVISSGEFDESLNENGWPRGSGTLAAFAWGGTLENVKVIEPDIFAFYVNKVGGLLGLVNNETSLTNCSVEGGIINTYTNGTNNMVQETGGLVGSAQKSDFADCSASVRITQQGEAAGGLIGTMNSGSLTRCFATGNVTSIRTNSPSHSVGGLVGFASDSLTSTDMPELEIKIRDCYATGSVKGGIAVGGLIGSVARCSFSADMSSVIENCYASGNVEGFDLLGGVFGSVSNSSRSADPGGKWTDETLSSSFTIRNCFAINRSVTAVTDGISYTDSWLGELGGKYVGDSVGLLDSEEMTVDCTALAPNSAEATAWKTYEDAGWSSDVWSIQEPGTYPVLVPGKAMVLTSSKGDVLTSVSRTTLTVENGKEGYQYRFKITNNDNHNVWWCQKDFQKSPSCEWWAGPAGAKNGKTITAYVKDAKGNDIATLEKTVDVSDSTLKIDKIISSKGTSLNKVMKTTLGAEVSGGKAPYEYRFRVYNKDTKKWYTMQDYKDTSSCLWYAGPGAGKKTIYVDVKDATGDIVSSTLDVKVSDSDLDIVSVTSSVKELKASSYTTLTANVKGGKSPYKYTFRVYNKDTDKWWTMQENGTDNACKWYAGPGAGNKAIYVDVKDADGNTASFILDVTVA